MNRAVFLDRDGTIIEEREYLSRPEMVALLPGAAPLFRVAQLQIPDNCAPRDMVELKASEH
jgi:histidinol phosphatase-like enzyme